jgi:uncharacterized spore protein YtfJ
MAEQNNVVEILKAVVSEIRDMARSETIIGEPITVGKRTVVPVTRVTFGFGAGGGQGEGSKVGEGFGGGGGGGAKVEPAAFIIMDEDGVSLLPASKGSIESIINAIPGLASKLAELGKKFSSKSKAKEASESE